MKKLMSQKEATRAQVLGLVDELKITQKEAAKRLNITPRHAKYDAYSHAIMLKECPA